MTETFWVSARRAGGVGAVSRSTVRSGFPGKAARALRLRLKELALSRPRYGYRRLHVLLRREGWTVNHKRTLRLYREEGLVVRAKRGRKRASYTRVPLPEPTKR